MATPYYSDGGVELWHGDMRELVGQFEADAVVTDPPYGETNLPWDRWPDGWPSLIPESIASMWCFGSLRMFTDNWSDFADWRLSHDTIGAFEVDVSVWHKHAGSGLHDDRFRRVHELMAHLYRGKWGDVYREPIRERSGMAKQGTRRSVGQVSHHGLTTKPWRDDGSRLAHSIIRAPSLRGRAIHPTEKPTAILAPLISYGVPLGGSVLDPFAGSCSTLLTARQMGRRAIGIEADEAMCEKAANRLSVPDLFTA